MGQVMTFALLQTACAFHAGIAYGASKGDIGQLTRAMAGDWSADDTTANAIGPGFFSTESTAPVFNDKDWKEHNACQTYICRNGEVEDLECSLLFLSSGASSCVAGQVLMFDGGFTAK